MSSGGSGVGGPKAPHGLYPLIDAAAVPLAVFPEVAAALVAAGCGFVQLRIKEDPPDGDRGRLAVQRAVAHRLSGGPPVVLVINDRADLARIAAQETPASVGVALHLGQTDLDAVDARAIVGPEVILGLSTHDLAQVGRAAASPVDYIGFGPIFGTDSKVGADPSTGLDALARACELSGHPVTAIGGLDADRAGQAVAAGASAAAMISALYRGLDVTTPAGLRALRERAGCLHDALR